MGLTEISKTITALNRQNRIIVGQDRNEYNIALRILTMQWQVVRIKLKRNNYVVNRINEQLFASKYKLYLPTKEELKAEIETQKAMFYLQQQDNEDRNKNYTFNIE